MDIHVDENKLQEYAEEKAKTIINNTLAHTSYNYRDILRQEIAKFISEHKDELLKEVKEQIDTKKISQEIVHQVSFDVLDTIKDALREC